MHETIVFEKWTQLYPDEKEFYFFLLLNILHYCLFWTLRFRW